MTEKTHKEDPFLTVGEVAAVLGRHPQTVRRWIDEGLIEYSQDPGGLKRVRTSHVERFLRGSNLQKVKK